MHQVEEVLERPAIIDNEPPHLVARLEQLIADMEVNPDSATVVEAWSITLELAQYEGPMAEVFAMVEASAAGDTTFNLVKDRIIKPVMYKTGPCEDECKSVYDSTRDRNRRQANADVIECAGYGGFAVALATTPLTLDGNWPVRLVCGKRDLGLLAGKPCC